MGTVTAAMPFLKVLAAFLLMLVGIRLKLGLSLSILLGGVLLGLFFGLPLAEIFRVGGLALLDEKFLLLLAIVGAILILSDGLEKSGQSARLMTALSGYLLRPRLRLIFFPALIGLLPMPGGAVFSAPMVKAVSAEMQLSNEELAIINHWFRHVWEMAWPLYPGIILTVALADIPLGDLLICSWPGVFAMFFIGWYFFLRPGVLKASKMSETITPQLRDGRQVFKEALPLLIAIVGAVGFETLLAKKAPHIPFEWGVIAALLLAIVWNMAGNRLGLPFLYEVLRKKSLWSMLMVIAAIFIFKDIMGAAGIVTAMAAGVGGGLIVFAAAVFLPFLVGAVSGVSVAFVGATFPLLLGLLQNLGLEGDVVAYLVLGLFSGFTGVMISPLHICFILTCSYFGTDLGATWRKLVAPCLCFAACGAALFCLLLF